MFTGSVPPPPPPPPRVHVDVNIPPPPPPPPPSALPLKMPPFPMCHSPMISIPGRGSISNPLSAIINQPLVIKTTSVQLPGSTSEPSKTTFPSSPAKSPSNPLINLFQFAPSSFPAAPSIISMFETKQNIVFNCLLHGSVQACLDSAPDKCQITIPAGSYPEKICIKKDVRLEGVGQVIFQSMDIKSSCVVSNITIQSNGNGVGGDAAIHQGNVQFFNCSFIASSSSAIIIDSFCLVYLNHCSVFSLDCPSLYISSTASVSVSDSTFDGSRDYGILITDSASIHISKSKIKNNQKGGILSKGDSDVVIDDCDIEINGAHGIEINSKGRPIISNSRICYHRNGSGILLSSKTPLTIEKCIFSQCIEASIHVSNGGVVFSFDNQYKDSNNASLILLNNQSSLSSSNDAFTGKFLSAIACLNGSELFAEGLNIGNSISSGLLASKNSIIRIEHSRISECSNIAVQCDDNVRIEFKNVEIDGGFKQALFLSNNVNGFFKDCSFKNNVNGVEIHNIHNLLFDSCCFINNKSTSMSIQEQCEVSIKKCQFTDNLSNAVEVEGSKCCPRFTECVICNNKGIGILSKNDASPVIEKCNINNNDPFGVVFDSSQGQIIECVIEKNKIGGIDIGMGSKTIINNSKIVSNGSIGVHLHHQGSFAKIISCSILNHQNGGGLVVISDSTAECDACIFDETKLQIIEVRNSSRVVLTKCKLSNSSKSSGIHVQGQSCVSIIESTIENCGKTSVFVGPTGSIEISGSILKNSSECSLSLSQTSSGIITDSAFEQNGQYGIVSQTTDIIIKNTKIIGASKIGIAVPKNTNIDEAYLTFDGCCEGLVKF